MRCPVRVDWLICVVIVLLTGLINVSVGSIISSAQRGKLNVGLCSQADFVVIYIENKFKSKCDLTYGQYFQFRVLGGKECVAVGNREWLYDTAPGSRDGTIE